MGRSAGPVDEEAGLPSSGRLGPGTSTPGPGSAGEVTGHKTIVTAAGAGTEEGGPYQGVGETPPSRESSAGTATVAMGTSPTWMAVLPDGTTARVGDQEAGAPTVRHAARSTSRPRGSDSSR
jgi:hypothetical protein